jgi:hypothetical protein
MRRADAVYHPHRARPAQPLPTLGVPVVPLVYMMVQMSSPVGGTAPTSHANSQRSLQEHWGLH